MKTIKLSITSLLLIGSLIVGCEEASVMNDSQIQKEPVLTRGLSYQIPSTSNPDLHANWEAVEKIVLNNGVQIDPPWKMIPGNSMNIPDEFRTDIKAVDGWKILSHTMLNVSSAEPNYILFYNSRRGVLKVFYYNPNIPNNSFVWGIESSTPSSILPSNTRIQGKLNTTYQYATTTNVLRESNLNFGHLNQGWNAFSYELIYGTLYNESDFHISGYNAQQSSLSLTGTYAGEVVIPS